MLAAGVNRDERQVERVILRIQANPEPPHAATADFDVVQLTNAVETTRERWTLSLQFNFMEEVPAELMVVNPMGNHHHLPAKRPRIGKRRIAMIEHLHDREKALEPFGLKGREAEWIALVLSPQRRVHKVAILFLFRYCAEKAGLALCSRPGRARVRRGGRAGHLSRRR